MAAARYSLYREPKQSSTWLANNPAQQLRASFTPEGVEVETRGDDGRSRRLGMKLRSAGYDARQLAVSSGRLTTRRNRAEINHQIPNLNSQITEWYLNTAAGLEQGFTLEAAPGERRDRERLRVVIELEGELNARAVDDGQALEFKDAAGWPLLLRYDHLVVTDGRGRKLEARMAARMQTGKGEVWLEVDDRHAVWPVTIDPTFTQQQKLVASDAAAGDIFGSIIAISGEMVVVGASFDSGSAGSNQGSAYVFVRSGGAWSEQQKLLASDAAGGDYFGTSVAISGETVVVGSPQLNPSKEGSAYVFVRGGGVWSQQQKLLASDAAVDDQFGWSVAISGETVVVGAAGDDGAAGSNQGSAYVFVRSGGVWSQQQKLSASDGAAGDEFGYSVAISGETVVVGARGDDGLGVDQGSAYVFVRSSGVWSEQQKLLDLDDVGDSLFGCSVAISGDTVVVGARGWDGPGGVDQGAADIFVRSGGVWSHQWKLIPSDAAADDQFGFSVAISGETVVVGARRDNAGAGIDQGSAYVFVRSGGVWSEQQKILASDAGAGDFFGASVAISGGTVVVGAPFNTGAQGSAYVFVLSGPLAELQELVAEDAAPGDELGRALAIAETTAAVGAPSDGGSAGAEQGAVYLFEFVDGTWAEQQKLVASDAAAGDEFGGDLAISEAKAVVGAPMKSSPTAAAQGAVYIFEEIAGVWQEKQKLLASDGAAGDRFGDSVAISEAKAAVGAPMKSSPTAAAQGAVYIFEEISGVWQEKQKLLASDGAAGDELGRALAISGDTAVVGAPGDTEVQGAAQGSAYSFKRVAGVWTEKQKLLASDAAAGDRFGESVAMSEAKAAIGAPKKSSPTAAEQIAAANLTTADEAQGAVYVFNEVAGVWQEEQKLLASDGAAGDEFGRAVAISGEKVVVGAPLNGGPAGAAQGAVYTFERVAGIWTEQQKLLALDAAAGDRLGEAVAISGETVMAGAPLNAGSAGAAQGSIHVFVPTFLNTMPTITAVGVTLQESAPASTSIIATVNDAEDAENTLTVTVDGAASATTNGVTVSSIVVNASGQITASIGAVCGATNAGFTLRVTDSGSLFAEDTLMVIVTHTQLTALSPAKVWVGLKNSDDVGTKFDFLAEVFKNDTLIGSGQLDGVKGGSSGFNNAVLSTISLALSGPVNFCPGDTLKFKLSVRVAANSGHRSGTARLWFNDAAANSRFGATINGVTNDQFLLDGFTLGTAAGVGPKIKIDVLVSRVGGNPFKPFGTWSKTF